MASAGRRTYIGEGRQTTDRALPGLELPDAPPGIDTVHESREEHLRERRNTIDARKRFREQIREYTKRNPGPLGRAEIRVRFVFGDAGVRCVVEWRDPRVGGVGILRRLDGPLALDARNLRRMGPGVALLGALKALERAMAE